MIAVHFHRALRTITIGSGVRPNRMPIMGRGKDKGYHLILRIIEVIIR